MEPRYYQMSYADDVKRACGVGFLSDRRCAWDLSLGRSVADVWPADQHVRMSDDYPKDKKLVDFVSNDEAQILVSPKLRDFLRSEALPDLEILPVAILDHDGAVASRDYSVVNCLRVVDCVDQQKSDFRWDGLESPSMVVSEMTLVPASLSADDRVIRPKFVPGMTFWREDVVEKMRAMDLTGLLFLRDIFGDTDVYRRHRH